MFKEKLIPWIRIYFSPRVVVRRGLAEREKNKRYLIGLVYLFGVCFILVQAFFRTLGDHIDITWILASSVMFGFPIGLVLWLMYSGIFYWIGRLLGGCGEWEELRIATAWAFIPYVSRLIIGLPQILLFGQELFKSYTVQIELNLLLLLLYVFFMILNIIFVLWFFFVLFVSIAEAHQFTIWQGMGTVLIGMTLLFFGLKYGLGIVIFPY